MKRARVRRVTAAVGACTRHPHLRLIHGGGEARQLGEAEVWSRVSRPGLRDGSPPIERPRRGPKVGRAPIVRK